MKLLEGLSILLVDDNEDSLELLELSLQMEGAAVRGARSAEAALEAVSDFTPSVLVSDLTLPGDDGCELLSKLRRIPNFGRLPAIAVTGHSDGEAKARALKAGFGAYVVKPINLNELARIVRGLVMADAR
jgi:CheY-like chemotaxis protein